MKIITEEMDVIDLRIACNGYCQGDVNNLTIKEMVGLYEGLTFHKDNESWKVKVLLKNN